MKHVTCSIVHIIKCRAGYENYVHGGYCYLIFFYKI
jgi:hypothetical protein